MGSDTHEETEDIEDLSNQWKDDDFIAFDESRKDDKDTQADDTQKSKAESDDMELSDNGEDLPPWLCLRRRFDRRSSISFLHNEIVEFCHLVEPTVAETEARQRVVDEVRNLSEDIFQKPQIHVFGSLATGLLLPTSDIDIMIVTAEGKNGNSPSQTDDGSNTNIAEDDWIFAGSPLQRFSNAVRDVWSSELSYLQIVENTKVPLVKFTLRDISVDVCFNEDLKSGPGAANLMKKYLHQLPPLRPLTFVLKYFLATRGLNEPYSGGIGSYLLQLLIVSFLQQRQVQHVPSNSSSSLNLGCLLLEFLELYGVGFNYFTTGISVRNSCYFPKGSQGKREVFWDATRPFLLGMENPIDPTANVGLSSFRIRQVQGAFAVAYKVLLAYSAEPREPTDSILGRILPIAPELEKRVRVKKRHQIGHSAGPGRVPSSDPREHKRRRLN